MYDCEINLYVYYCTYIYTMNFSKKIIFFCTKKGFTKRRDRRQTFITQTYVLVTVYFSTHAPTRIHMHTKLLRVFNGITILIETET